MICTCAFSFTITRFRGCTSNADSLPVEKYMISIGRSATLFLGMLIYAPSFANAVFSDVRLSFLLAIILTYRSMIFLYCGFVGADDISQTTVRPWAVAEWNGLHTPT